MDHLENPRPGMLGIVRRLFASVLAILHNRLELLSVELREERLRFFHALLLLAAVVGAACFTIGAAATALFIVVWNRWGATGLLLISAVGLLVTLLIYWQLHERLKNWPLLSGTLAEIKKDREWLEDGL